MSRRDESTASSRLQTVRSPKSVEQFQCDQDGFGILRIWWFLEELGGELEHRSAVEKGPDRGSALRCNFSFLTPLWYSLGLRLLQFSRIFFASATIHVASSSLGAVVLSLFGLVR
jgi:hypothetical protein